MINVRLASYMRKRDQLGELLDAADAAKEKFESSGTVTAHTAYKSAAESVFQH